MVEKKIIKRGKNTFGPYYYENKKSGNKVDKVFIGGKKDLYDWKRKNPDDIKPKEVSKYINLFFIILILVIIGGFFYISSSNKITGFTVSSGPVKFGAQIFIYLFVVSMLIFFFFRVFKKKEGED